MNANTPAQKTFGMRQTGCLLGILGAAALALLVLRPFFLQVTDQAGPFHITLSPVDLDLDGDLDVLVHNMRQPGEFEAYAGGALWINQGGLQGGQLGQFSHRLNDIEGGWASTTADLDGDGDADMLVFDGGSLALGINQGGEQGQRPGMFLKRAEAKPSAALKETYGNVVQFGRLVSGDIDNDGRNDAIILGWGQGFTTIKEKADHPNLSWIWHNELDAQGSYRRDFASLDALEGLPVGEAALGDLNGDGDLDLFAVILKTRDGFGPGPTSMVLLNDGSGIFRDSGQRLNGGKTSSAALGDLDGDGDLDAVTGNERGAVVWINQGGAQPGQAGTFAASDRNLSGRETHSVRLDDPDRDSDLDVLVVGQQEAALWWNDGKGRFTKQPAGIPTRENQDITTGDFNGDGYPDILVATYDDTIRVWWNDGSGHFLPGEYMQSAREIP